MLKKVSGITMFQLVTILFQVPSNNELILLDYFIDRLVPKFAFFRTVEMKIISIDKSFYLKFIRKPKMY